MSNTRFTHYDNDGDLLIVRSGMLGAVVDTRSEYAEEQVEVSVRYEFLPALIEALQGILDESDTEATK